MLKSGEDRQRDGEWMIHIRESKIRIIPLSENLKGLLFYRKKHIGPLFPSYYGHPKEVSKKFRKYADKAGLKNVKLHDMRQTSATFMLLQEVPLKIVSGILGHTTVKTTGIYTKLIAEHFCTILINCLQAYKCLKYNTCNVF